MVNREERREKREKKSKPKMNWGYIDLKSIDRKRFYFSISKF